MCIMRQDRFFFRWFLSTRIETSVWSILNFLNQLRSDIYVTTAIQLMLEALSLRSLGIPVRANVRSSNLY